MKPHVKTVYVIAAVATILVAGVLVWSPAGHIRPYDADLRPLAETELEGWCSGYVFMTFKDGAAHPAESSQCRTNPTNTDRFSSDVNTDVVVDSFCDGIVTVGFGAGKATCVRIMEDRNLWPTLHGELTAAWSATYPYPGGDIFKPAKSDNQPGGLDRGQTR
jgi:hypothetical protein